MARPGRIIRNTAPMQFASSGRSLRASRDPMQVRQVSVEGHGVGGLAPDQVSIGRMLPAVAGPVVGLVIKTIPDLGGVRGVVGGKSEDEVTRRCSLGR